MNVGAAFGSLASGLASGYSMGKGIEKWKAGQPAAPAATAAPIEERSTGTDGQPAIAEALPTAEPGRVAQPMGMPDYTGAQAGTAQAASPWSALKGFLQQTLGAAQPKSIIR